PRHVDVAATSDGPCGACEVRQREACELAGPRAWLGAVRGLARSAANLAGRRFCEAWQGLARAARSQRPHARQSRLPAEEVDNRNLCSGAMAAATRWKLVRATGDGMNMEYQKGQIVGYVPINSEPIAVPLPRRW